MGILLTGMIGSQEAQVAGELVMQPVAEAWEGRGQGNVKGATGPQTGIEGDFSQGQQQTHLSEQLQFCV